ncbi:MAG: DUF72 domain-containing protein, partial [Gemmatimonadota bacterium]|nr:DUF72 domain-containing protein [Gemmatimonadota bacterium]
MCAADPAYDPGPEVAGDRAAAAGVSRATELRTPSGGSVVIGTAGWTHRTILAPGVFYPDDATTADARLRYYASRFPMVEVDASYYALPTAQNAELWARRTPEYFTFDVKAFALMTGHPTEVARFPKALREALPADVAAKRRVYPKDLPGDIYDSVWRTFVDALAPLRDAGKLGAVLLQYPPWLVPGGSSRDVIVEAKERLEGLRCAVELRNRLWFAPKTAERTFAFLEEHGLPFVIVDEPQGLASSVPPMVAVTSPELAIIRMHGQRGDMWARPGASVEDKYRYLYGRDQLEEWVPKVEEAAERARRVHV